MLRLYCPDAHELSAPTLSEFYRSAFLPLWIQARKLSAATRTSYEESVSHWVRLTGDPPLDQIDDQAVASFAARLYELPGRRSSQMSEWTAHKHVRQLQRILDFAGPKTRDRAGRMNQAVIDLPPLIPRPGNPPKAPRPPYTTDELQKLISAASDLARPAWHPDPPAYWRSLLSLLATTGLRIGEALAAQWNHVTRSPDFPGAWLDIPPTAHKSKKSKRQYVPLQAFESLQSAPRVDDHLIPWPGKHRRWLDRLFHRLHDAAGIPPHRQLGFHAIRRWHLTTVRRLGFFHSRDLARAAAGHSDTATTLAHYLDPTAEDEILAATLERLPILDPARRPESDDRDDGPTLGALPG